MNDDTHHFQDDLYDDFNHDNMDKNNDHQNREDMINNEQPYIEEQHTQELTVETQRLTFHSLFTDLEFSSI